MSSIPEFNYCAFISYRHVPPDREVAEALQERLESYRVPRGLRPQWMPDGRLAPIFRDATDLSAAPHLEAAIFEKLAESRFLIVLCSPAAAREGSWVEREIDAFVARRGREAVLGVWVDGEIGEALPRPLRGEREPHLPDLRSAKSRKAKTMPQASFMKLVAAMIGADPDALVRRDLARRRRQWAGLAAIILAALAVIGYFAIQAQYAADAKTRSENAKLAQRLAASAEERQRAKDPILARLLALEACRFDRESDGSAFADVDRALRLTMSGEESVVELGPFAGITVCGIEIDPARRDVLVSGAVGSESMDKEGIRAARGRMITFRGSRRKVTTLNDRSHVTPIYRFSPDGGKLFGVDVEGSVWTQAADGNSAVEEHGRITVDPLNEWVAIGPNGETIAVRGARNRVDLWTRDGVAWSKRELSPAKGRSVEPVGGIAPMSPRIALSPDGGTAAAIFDDGSVHAWDVSTGAHTPLSRPSATGEFGVANVAFADGGRLLAASDSSVTVWRRTEDGWDVLGEESVGAKAILALRGAAASPVFAASRVLGGTGVTIIRPLAKLVFEQQRSARTQPWFVAVSPDGMTTASSYIDGKLELHDRGGALAQVKEQKIPAEDMFETGGADPKAIAELMMAVNLTHGTFGRRRRIALSRDGSTVIATYPNLGVGAGVAKVWRHGVAGADPEDLQGPGLLAFGTGMGDKSIVLPALGFASSREGPIFLAAYGATLLRWDLDNVGAKPRRVKSLDGNPIDLAFPRAVNRVAALLDDGRVQTIDTESWNVRDLGGVVGPPRAITATENGRIVLAAAATDRVQLWTLDGSESDPAEIVLPGEKVVSLAAVNNRIAAVATESGSIRLYDLTGDRRQVHAFEIRDGVPVRMQFSRDGRLLAVAVQRTNTKTGKSRKEELLSPTGGLATRDESRGVWIYRLDRTSAAPLRWLVPEGGISDLAFGPDDAFIATIGDDSTMRVWWTPETEKLVQSAERDMPRNLTQKEWREFIGADRPYRRTIDELPDGE